MTFIIDESTMSEKTREIIAILRKQAEALTPEEREVAHKKYQKYRKEYKDRYGELPIWLICTAKENEEDLEEKNDYNSD